MRKCIIDIKKISSLNFIKWDEQEGLCIGALTPIADCRSSAGYRVHAS